MDSCSGSIGPGLRASSPVLWWIVNIPAITAAWWFSMWFLLAGRVPWCGLYPSAVTTDLFFVGMLTVFSITFSGMVISGAKKYGAP